MIVEDLFLRTQNVEGYRKYDKLLAEYSSYFITVKRLKYLRRWNRINRILSTSVMGHTYLVAVLTIMFSLIADAGNKLPKPFSVMRC